MSSTQIIFMVGRSWIRRDKEDKSGHKLPNAVWLCLVEIISILLFGVCLCLLRWLKYGMMAHTRESLTTLLPVSPSTTHSPAHDACSRVFFPRLFHHLAFSLFRLFISYFISLFFSVSGAPLPSFSVSVLVYCTLKINYMHVKKTRSIHRGNVTLVSHSLPFPSLQL